MTKHQQLNILGQIRTDQHGQQAEQAPHQPVDKRQHHLAIVAATAPITQQNTSSQHETVFPSGTRVGLAGGDEIQADLVVDAMGRGSRLPVWLDGLGYPQPAEERVAIDFRYTTREFRRTPGDLGRDRFIVLAPTAAEPRGGVALAIEGDRWIATLGGYHGDVAPDGLSGFVAYAASLPAPDVHELVAKAEPVGEARGYRVPASVRRRYDRLSRSPEGLVAIGDAVCAFNPIYGQGMTVAATEAAALRDWAVGGARDPRAYFRAIARLIDGPWGIVVGGDLRLSGVEGVRTTKIRLVNAYLERFHLAAAADPALGRTFLRVANLLDPPYALFRPGAP